ncbi:MAG: TolC family protein, partial [Planctomycetales bacterium]|nr:TolC family protein [Planctomycetales bacterium]
ENPLTVMNVDQQLEPEYIDLDEAIRQALANSEIVRILAASGAASSGLSIYDPAIANARIDQQQAAFDPTFDMRHDFLRSETPFATRDPLDPTRTVIAGSRDDAYSTSLGLTKRIQNGARADARVNVDVNRTRPVPGLLDPQSRSSATLSLTQPLLQGAGRDVNRVPIVLARIDAESSYFRLKDSLQENVRGVIQGYWDLVAARTQLWAVEQQIAQAEQVLRREEALLRTGGDTTRGQVAQARVAYTNFVANRLASFNNLLEREAAFRGVLGLPPNTSTELLPMSAPITTHIDFNWDELLELAERSRPDLIELKLILEADTQLILQATNRTLPQFDAVALYRWNGLEGEIPINVDVGSRPGEFTDWQLGVNFSVPIGLRQSRATLRERELILSRDRAAINQSMLEISHALAASLRRLELQYQQIEAFREARLAAAENLEQQVAMRGALTTIIVVLQAITDWGNAISSEARALAQYNAELATLERLTGTILETHGVRFFEERYASIGPLGVCGPDKCYPRALRPSENTPRYTPSDRTVDTLFQEGAPPTRPSRRRTRSRDDAERLPPPEPTSP